MLIRKSTLCSEYIEALVDFLVWLNVGDLENGVQADAKILGIPFEVSFKSWLQKNLKNELLQFVYKIERR